MAPVAPAVLHRVDIGSVSAVFTGRSGGASAAPYDGANLAPHVGDRPEAVEINRRMLSDALLIATEWSEVSQVHGAVVVEARPGCCGEGDALVLADAGLPAAIFTADCVPVLLVGKSGEAAAVVHAGWRGLDAGVVEAAAEALTASGDACGTAVFGPCIGPCCYAISEDLAARFAKRFGAGVVVDGRYLNLKAAARAALGRTASGSVSIIDVGPCTHSPELFSYRHDGPTTGRQAVVAWLS